MDRKGFLRTCGALTAGGIAGLLAPQGCAPVVHYAALTESEGVVTIPLSEFTDDDGGPRNHLLARVRSLNKPIAVYRSGPGQFTAVSTVCTHRGCEVRLNPGYLACPCHGSEFSPDGSVLQGPAELPLRRYTVIANERDVTIRL